MRQVQAYYHAPNIGVPNILNLRGFRFMAAGEGGDDGGSGEQQQNGGNNSGWTPPATQDDLNRIITERVQRERAKYADYEELRGKAARLDEVETQATEKAEAAEAALAEVPVKVTETLRTHLIALHKITKDDADLFLTAKDPETLLKQVAGLTRRTGGNRVPREGTTTSTDTTQGDDERTFVRSLFGGGTT